MSFQTPGMSVVARAPASEKIRTTSCWLKEAAPGNCRAGRNRGSRSHRSTYSTTSSTPELAGVFLAWARASKLLPDSTELDLGAEAVANPIRRIGAEEYRDLLGAILTETRRTLKPHGRIILTYHNTDLRAWWALGSALRDAGLSICALAVTQAENERDHAKRDRLGFSS